MEQTLQALDAVLARIVFKLTNTLTSTKFWFCLAGVLLGYLEGGQAGLIAALGAIGVFGGTKAYQNVQLKKADIKLKGEEITAPKPLLPVKNFYFDDEEIDVENEAEDIAEEMEIGEGDEEFQPKPKTLYLGGLLMGWIEEGISSPFALYSRLQAKCNTFDLRAMPKREWIGFAVKCVEKLTELLQQSYAVNINYPVPNSCDEIGAHPRDLLFRIKKSIPCGQYVGETERVHVRGLWRRFKQHQALLQIAGTTIDWKKKYGQNRVTPLMVARAARRGDLV